MIGYELQDKDIGELEVVIEGKKNHFYNNEINSLKIIKNFVCYDTLYKSLCNFAINIKTINRM